MARSADAEPAMGAAPASTNGHASGGAPHPTGPAQRSAAAKVVAEDQAFSALSLVLWCVTSAKSALLSPTLTSLHNLQSLAGAAAILLVGLAWPSVAPRSYVRWRVAALAALRFTLLALPYNFEEGLWDDMFPGPATGHRLAWALNLSNLALGTGLVMLVLTALGWRLPIRVHMVLQAALVALWAHFGATAHCRSKLLMSPEVMRGIAGVYSAGELAVAVLVPFVVRPPGGPSTQAAAVLLFAWLVVGWLLPTLLLLLPSVRDAAAAPAQQQQPARQQPPQAAGVGGSGLLKRVVAFAGHALARLEAAALLGLRSLLTIAPPQAHRAQREQQARQGQQAQRGQSQPGMGWLRRRRGGRSDDVALPYALSLSVRWLTLLVLVWMACRAVAPWYAAEGTPLGLLKA